MRRSRRFAFAVLFASIATLPLHAQDRLKSMPGYDQYVAMAPKIAGAVKSGAVAAQWAEDARSFDFMRDGKRWRFDLASRKIAEAPAAAANGGRAAICGGVDQRLVDEGDLQGPQSLRGQPGRLG